MKVAVDTLELTDDILKSIRRSNQQPGKATRAEAKAFISGAISELLDDLVDTYPPHSRPSKVPSIA